MFSYLNPIPKLPEYPGPFKVGTTEYEIPTSEIPSTSTVPDPSITTVKFRIFYPTNQNATSRTSLYWLPSPQTRWNQAYASFMGASPTFSSVLAYLPSLLSYIKLPAFANAPLRHRTDHERYPLAIFSHGLGGNYNTYSSIVGSLASCGIVCVAPEHRDGSAPISFIQDSSGTVVKTIDYQKLSHSPSIDVLNARNQQLRVRLWELELIYSAVKSMNDGMGFTNYAEVKDEQRQRFAKQLNMAPGRVTWAGHSFGAATITQFVKSIHYRDHSPTYKEEAQDEWDRTPLYTPQSDCEVLQQITNKSPVCLLDLWTMPLRGETTKWLWERPLPCYHKSDDESRIPSVIAIMSAEFYRYTDLLNRTRALLSRHPDAAIELMQQKRDGAGSVVHVEDVLPPPISELSKQDPSPAQSSASSRSQSPSSTSYTSESPASSRSSLSFPEATQTPSEEADSNEPHLYLVPQSAHLSQSDFGPLFPNLTRYVMKAIEPEKTIELNIRAILFMMSGSGLPVENLTVDADPILSEKDLNQGTRWERIPLVDT